MPIVTTPSGLQIEDIIVGSGPTASVGQHVIVHYTGWQEVRFERRPQRALPLSA